MTNNFSRVLHLDSILLVSSFLTQQNVVPEIHLLIFLTLPCVFVFCCNCPTASCVCAGGVLKGAESNTMGWGTKLEIDVMINWLITGCCFKTQIKAKIHQYLKIVAILVNSQFAVMVPRKHNYDKVKAKMLLSYWWQDLKEILEPSCREICKVWGRGRSLSFKASGAPQRTSVFQGVTQYESNTTARTSHHWYSVKNSDHWF